MQTGLLQKGIGANLPWNSWGWSLFESGCRTRWPDLLWQFYFLFTWKHTFSWGGGGNCNQFCCEWMKWKTSLFWEVHCLSDYHITRSIKQGVRRSRRESISSFLAFRHQQKYREKLLVVGILTCFHYNFSVSFSWKRRCDMSWLNEMSSECWMNYIEHRQGLGIVLIWLLWRKHQ